MEHDDVDAAAAAADADTTDAAVGVLCIVM